MIRELLFGDLERLREMNPNFPFPDISSGLYCSQKALVHEGRLAGAAFLKLTSEAMLILDPKVNGLNRAALIGEAFDYVPEELDRFGLDQVHVFVLPENDEKYAELLKKHFKFERARGIPLVLTRSK